MFQNLPGVKSRTSAALFPRLLSEAVQLRGALFRLCFCVLQETEADKLCRKLELKDHVPCQMQRLTKYPMLIENLLKYTQSSKWSIEILHWTNKQEEPCVRCAGYAHTSILWLMNQLVERVRMNSWWVIQRIGKQWEAGYVKLSLVCVAVWLDMETVRLCKALLKLFVSCSAKGGSQFMSSSVCALLLLLCKHREPRYEKAICTVSLSLQTEGARLCKVLFTTCVSFSSEGARLCKALITPCVSCCANRGSQAM